MRDEAAAAALADAGVARVVIGHRRPRGSGPGRRRLAAAPAGRRRPRRRDRRGRGAGLGRGLGRRAARRRCRGFADAGRRRRWSSPRSHATAPARGPRPRRPRGGARRHVARRDRLRWRRHAGRPRGARSHWRSAVGAWPAPSSARPSTRVGSTSLKPSRGRRRAGPAMQHRPRDPVPRRRRRPRRQGRELRRPARRRRSGRAGRPLRRRGRRRARVPRHHRVLGRPRHDRRVARRTAEQVFIPFTIGGGIRSVDDARRAAAGRRRQGVGQHRRRRASRADHARSPPSSAPSASSCAIDARRRTATGGWSRCSPTAAAPPPASTPWRGPSEAEQLGAGEILLTSMDRDGTREGFDLELTRAVTDAVDVPVIASGGVGTPRAPRRGRARGRGRRGARRVDLPLRRAHRRRGQAGARRPRRDGSSGGGMTSWRRAAALCVVVAGLTITAAVCGDDSGNAAAPNPGGPAVGELPSQGECPPPNIATIDPSILKMDALRLRRSCTDSPRTSRSRSRTPPTPTCRWCSRRASRPTSS